MWVQQPASNVTGVACTARDFGEGVEASEPELIMVGNLYATPKGQGLIASHSLVLAIRRRAIRAASNEAGRAIRDEIDHVTKDLDNMQQSLLNEGIMVNPEAPTIEVLRDLERPEGYWPTWMRRKGTITRGKGAARVEWKHRSHCMLDHHSDDTDKQ